MTTRSRETTGAFSRASALSERDRPLPGGTCRIVDDEEGMPAHFAFGRTATKRYIAALPAPGGVNAMRLVDPDERAAAAEADGVAA